MADACGSGSGAILPLVGTANVIGDIDRLREALGEEQVSFIGISYGTLTGLRYAERYPEHVRALILDAPVDPALDEVGWGRASVLTLQRLFDEFLAACAADEACAIHGDRRPRETFETLVTRLSVAAVEGVSAKSLWDVLYSGLRQPDQLDEWLAEIRDGDMTSTKAMLQNAADPDSVGYSLGVACADVEHPVTATGVDSLVDELRPAAPDFAWRLALSFGCVGWPEASERAAPITAPGAPAIMVIGSTDDSSTPYSWAVSVAEALESGVLLTREGHGHGSMDLDNACIDAITDAYLIDTTVPAPGTVCS